MAQPCIAGNDVGDFNLAMGYRQPRAAYARMDGVAHSAGLALLDAAHK